MRRVIIEPKELIKVPTMEEFNRIRDSLNLSDRQKIIFEYKYSKLWRNIDIATEMKLHQDTISGELTIIRKKLAAIQQK